MLAKRGGEQAANANASPRKDELTPASLKKIITPTIRTEVSTFELND